MTKLSVNLNKVALVRNSRDTTIPSVVDAAITCLEAGAEGITVHPRPDQRHIRPNDVRDLAQLLRDDKYKDIEFNIEGNPFAPALNDYPGFIELVEETQPDQCTLVPDGDDKLTSDHGCDLNSSGDQLAPIIKRLKDQGMRVSLFMDPDLSQIEMAANIGADRIELYTGPYAAAWGTDQLEPLFQSHLAAAELAVSLGMGVNAGHDLNLDNLAKYASIPALLEVSIGHAFTVDSLAMGMANAVNAYLQRLR